MSQSQAETGLTPQDRARLADKGQRLYGKYCGTDGRGICAESFALHHIGRGESEVAEDLLAFVEGKVAELRREDPDGRLAMTEALASRLRQHLLDEDAEPPDPADRASILKAKKAAPPGSA